MSDSNKTELDEVENPGDVTDSQDPENITEILAQARNDVAEFNERFDNNSVASDAGSIDNAKLAGKVPVDYLAGGSVSSNHNAGDDLDISIDARSSSVSFALNSKVWSLTATSDDSILKRAGVKLAMLGAGLLFYAVVSAPAIAVALLIASYLQQ